jgi:hypothetical protein
MAMTLDELAIVVDSTISVCIEDALTVVQIIGLQQRVGAGPTLRDVSGTGVDETAARAAYFPKLAGQVVVIGGNPRGLEIRVPTTLVAGP